MPSNSDASNLIAQKLYSKKMSERHPDRLRRTQLPALAVWAVVIGALLWYAVSRPGIPIELAALAAIAVGVGLGMSLRPKWFSLGFVPLIVFIVGGVLLSTQVSNSHGFEGGDWSDAAAAALAGVLTGGMASIAFLATFLARTPLRTLVAGR